MCGPDTSRGSRAGGEAANRWGRIGEQYYQQGGPPPSLTTYTWDAAHHLLQIQQSAAGAVDLTNSYRPDGLRHRRTDASGTTQMIWDGEEPLAQVDTSGNLIQ